MANHRWETSPSVPRLFPSRLGPASFEGSAVTSGEPELEDRETADDQARGGTPVGAWGAVLVNINTASLQELDALPRVGPVTFERIIAWRDEHGRFARPEDVDAVPGIGEDMLAALLPLITV